MSPPEYKLLPSNPKYKLRPIGAAPARRLRAARRAGICLFWAKTTRPRILRPSWMPAPQPYTGKRVYLRVGALGAHGFVVRLCVMLSAWLTSASFQFGAPTSQIFNGVRDEAALDVHNACRMKDHLPQERRNDLVHGWCAGEAAALAEVECIQAEMVDCTGIVDFDEREITEDLHGCVSAWVRERLAPATPSLLPPPLTLPPTRPVTVGIHIRWGDTGTPDTSPSHFRGSMNSAEERVLAELKETN
ncbi:hypothetical protein FB451DRAFT_1387262 [Mycena latifolia]|nr:hypothetical protein FB451DRAFT_1387262 [Mycena latifolia]